LFILKQGIDPAVVDGLGVIGSGSKNLEGVAIVTIQSILSAYP